jgi:hypothetical protein
MVLNISSILYNKVRCLFFVFDLFLFSLAFFPFILSYALSFEGDIGEKTLIEPWSGNNDAVILSSNLGSGAKDDCSGIVNRGKPLDAKKIHISTNSQFSDENILVATVPTN